MSETSSSHYMASADAAWTKVGEAVNHAAELYLTEVSAYLNWTRNLQRELLEESFLATQAISRVGEKQLAFLARIRESAPAFGVVPKGTETLTGMVEAIVQETGSKA